MGMTYLTFGFFAFYDGKTINKNFSYFMIAFWLLFWIISSIIQAPGSSWYFGWPFVNVNDMSFAFILLLLFDYIHARKLNPVLFLSSAFYAVAFDRRGSIIALAFLFLAELILRRTIPIKNAIAYILIIVAVFSFNLSNMRSFQWMKANSIESTTFPDASIGIRLGLAKQMLSEIKDMPSYQIIFGKGLGQLKLFKPTDPTIAPFSPHFFWLEMFFYLGVVWFFFLLLTFFKGDMVGKISLIVVTIVGTSPSSLIYYMPFYLFLGFFLAYLNQKTFKSKGAQES